MSKNLVIVESPAKAKTIENYLGKDYIVKSSFGHVRDLAKKGLSVDIENGFDPVYEVSSDKKQVVSELKKLAKAAEIVWLATDEDREGEAISWHLTEALNLDKKDTRRITFNEITKSAILKAIDNYRTVNQKLVDAHASNILCSPHSISSPSVMMTPVAGSPKHLLSWLTIQFLYCLKF